MQSQSQSSRYAAFVQSCRKEYEQNHSKDDIVYSEFMKDCKEQWKTFLINEKKSNKKVRTTTETCCNCKEGLPPLPKRPLSAFFWYCDNHRGSVMSQHPEFDNGDVAKELGRMWFETSPDEKLKYQAMTNKDEDRYEKEMKVFKQKLKKSNPYTA